MQIVLLIVMMGVFYFILIRPQQRKVKEHQALVAALEVGDDVVTSGGIYGQVTAIDGEVLKLEVADGVELLLAREAIAELVEYSSPDDDDDQD
ncbi:MAG: preprotein translocase subunit YajC [Acidimicrobiales bacterium]|nr:preprotein translocase subunit YajC [Acidimicrobiales bacterium]